MQDVPSVRLTMDWAARAATLAVPRELDPLTCAQLHECLAWIAQNRPRRLVLDFGGLADSFVEQIRLLAVARRQLLPGCVLDVRSADPAMRTILDITGWAGPEVRTGHDELEPAPASLPDNLRPASHP